MNTRILMVAENHSLSDSTRLYPLAYFFKSMLIVDTNNIPWRTITIFFLITSSYNKSINIIENNIFLCHSYDF